jgi:glycyl-tRNA synthetase beta chain
MVGEFPTLQGIMGREYALRAGEPEEVAQGIEDHYRPYAHDGALPQSTTGALVGMADRLDSLLGFFSLGQIPTGSADPYALRRMAQGLILVIWDKGYSLSLSQVFDRGLEPFTKVAGEAFEPIKKNLFEFFNLRLGHLLEAEGLGRETIEAVLAGGWDDLGEVKARAQALDQFQQHPDFSSLTKGCKRALNILKGLSASELGAVDKALLIEPQELELFALIREKEERLNQLFREQKFLAYLQALAQLRTPIDAFFDKVLVMAPDNQVKNNRLALLFYLTSFFNRFAVFSKFSISG